MNFMWCLQLYDSVNVIRNNTRKPIFSLISEEALVDMDMLAVTCSLIINCCCIQYNEQHCRVCALALVNVLFDPYALTRPLARTVWWVGLIEHSQLAGTRMHCMKITKNVTTRWYSQAWNAQKCVFHRGFVPDPIGGADSTPQSLSWISGRLLRDAGFQSNVEPAAE